MVEGANGPTTLVAESVLTDMDVAIVLDIVANAGRVISSYFERVQNRQRMSWPEAKERDRVLERLDTTWSSIAKAPAAEWRNRALTSAISRVLEGMAARGLLLPGTIGAAGDGRGAR